MTFKNTLILFLLFGTSVPWIQGASIHQRGTKSLSRRQQTARTVGSTIHFGDSSSSATLTDNTRSQIPLESEAGLDSNYQRYARNLDPFGSESMSSLSFSSPTSEQTQQQSYSQFADPHMDLDWSSPTGQQSSVANFARGSNEEDSFTVQSGIY